MLSEVIAFINLQRSKIDLGQLFVYGLVGVLTNLLDIGLYWFLIDVVGLWYLYAYLLGTPLIMSFNYLSHRRFTFKSDGSKREQLPRYVALFVFNYFIGAGLLYLLVDLIGWHYLIGKLISIVVIVAYNFIALKIFVFRDSSEHQSMEKDEQLA